MTIDTSLKSRRGIVRARNVLTRAEQITKLQDMDKWTEETSPFGLPKVRVYKVVVRKKKKKEKEDDAATPAKKGGKK